MKMSENTKKAVTASIVAFANELEVADRRVAGIHNAVVAGDLIEARIQMALLLGTVRSLEGLAFGLDGALQWNLGNDPVLSEE